MLNNPKDQINKGLYIWNSWKIILKLFLGMRIRTERD